MNITITWQSVITVFSVVSAAVGLIVFFSKGVRWFDKQNAQDNEIKELRKHHDEDIAAIKQELALLVHGNLACLKGLSEQGCNGPVSEAIRTIEDHLNQKAHE